MSEENLKNNFAANLGEYRRQSGMTQLELADKLNYSDKSVSKWERAEGLPDLCVAVQIAELFGITLNDLVNPHRHKKPLLFRNKLLTTLLSVALVWLVAVILFFLFELINVPFNSAIIFVYALPASSVVAIVFCALWWNLLWQFISISLLIWTIPVCIVLTVPLPPVFWIFLIAAVIQVMAILWHLMKR